MPADSVNLYLVGFMGVGKSTVGHAAAGRLGFGFLDSDHCIERKVGKPIPRIFAEEGEAVFRGYEREFMETGHPERGYVIACGGGLIIPEGMLDLVKSKGVVVCLHASLETILERTSKNQNRPLLNVENPADRLRSLYAQRSAVYQQAGTLLLTENRTPADIVAHVLRVYRREAATFRRAAVQQ